MTVRGDIDLATAGELWATIDAGLAPDHVVIDLAETSFIDSSGLTVLVKAHRRLEEVGGVLVLRSPNPAARKLFDITGFDRLATIKPR